MQEITDRAGVLYELFNVGNGNVRFQAKNFPEMSHIYKASFIDSAIQAGLLTELPEKFVPQKLKMQGV